VGPKVRLLTNLCAEALGVISSQDNGTSITGEGRPGELKRDGRDGIDIAVRLKRGVLSL